MLGFPLGILSAAGAEVEAGAYELIATDILSSATPSITFSNLGDYSSTYKHLQVRALARSSNAAAFVVLKLRLNGDTGTNYSNHALRGASSTVISFGNASQDNVFAASLVAAGSTANSFTGMVVDLLDTYSTSKNKTVRSLSGTGGGNVFFTSGVHLSTASMTSITLFSSADNFVAGSRFSLYGIKG